MLTVLVLIALAAAVSAAIAANRDPNTPTAIEQAMRDARDAADGPIDNFGAALAGPITRTKFVRQASTSAMWKNLRQQVVGSGMFGGSFEVYLSYQLAHLIFATAFLLIAVTAQPSGLMAFVTVVAAVVGGAYPTLKMKERLRKREDVVGTELPEFVELLTMCLTTMTVKQAIAFTVQFTTGTVANSARWLLDTLESRTMDEAEAFREAGVRVGTSEAIAFFTSLGRGHIEGAKVLDIINRQAESLRVQAFNRRRANLKKLPTKMILVFGIHFLPLLFIVASIPLLLGFKDF